MTRIPLFVSLAVLCFLPHQSTAAANRKEAPDESKNTVGFILGGDDRARQPAASDSTGEQPDACGVKRIEILTDGTRPDYSWDGKRIAFDRKVKKTYEVFIMDADGSDERCLTCGDDIPLEMRGKHKGKATFHPGGRYLLFSAENEHGKGKMIHTPGFGDEHDFWVTDLESGGFKRLTNVPKGHALQYPRFSPDGKRLLFSERYVKGKMRTMGAEFGQWWLKFATFEVTDQGPTFTKVVKSEPGGKGFYEPHGFTPDASGIIFTAALTPGKSQILGDIYTYHLGTRKLINLTESDDLHDEQALYSPDGKKIAWMRGPFVGMLKLAYASDVYLMDADGKNRVRLTRFNIPGAPEYNEGHTLIDKIAWHPDGTSLVTAFHSKKKNKIFKVHFNGPCGKMK